VAESLIIETNGLEKRYDGVTVLDGLTLAVPAGSIYGLLGRNGAGKTTVIKILMGMVRPTAGRATVFGLPASEPETGVAIRQRTGFASDGQDLYDSMTVAQLIDFTAGFFPRWRADMAQRYVRSFELPIHRTVKVLSRGARAKLALLLAFCRGAELLILDEATAGLDPIAIDEVLQVLVAHVASEGVTVFFSSHQLGEIEKIADHVAIIGRGRTVLASALDDLRESYRRIEIVFEGDAPEVRFRSPGVRRVRRKGRMLTVLAGFGSEQIIGEAHAFGAVSVQAQTVSLNEILLEIIEEKG
jgi:ABC-2 type transport system ATP-binding protein